MNLVNQFFNIIQQKLRKIKEEKMGEKEIKNLVKKTLKQIGIQINFKGFHYLQTLIAVSINKDFNMNEYKIVAARHHTTAINVERAIRYICDTQQEKLQKYFETDYKITNSVLYELLREKSFRRNRPVQYETREFDKLCCNVDILE